MIQPDTLLDPGTLHWSWTSPDGSNSVASPSWPAACKCMPIQSTPSTVPATIDCLQQLFMEVRVDSSFCPSQPPMPCAKETCGSTGCMERCRSHPECSAFSYTAGMCILSGPCTTGSVAQALIPHQKSVVGIRSCSTDQWFPQPITKVTSCVGLSEGVHIIFPDNRPLRVYCDGAGWTQVYRLNSSDLTPASSIASLTPDQPENVDPLSAGFSQAFSRVPATEIRIASARGVITKDGAAIPLKTAFADAPKQCAQQAYAVYINGSGIMLSTALAGTPCLCASDSALNAALRRCSNQRWNLGARHRGCKQDRGAASLD